MWTVFDNERGALSHGLISTLSKLACLLEHLFGTRSSSIFKLSETRKTLLFALFDSILELDGCPLLSEGERVRRSADARERMRRSSSLEKKHLR